MTVHCPENRSGLESIDDFVDQLLAQDHHRLLADRLGALFGLDYELLLYDVTSTYFEGEAAANPILGMGYFDIVGNEKLVRDVLLQGPAAAARFLGLKNGAPTPDMGAVSAWETFARVPRPFDMVVLGMGDDGHTASLFPGSPNLASALNPAAAAGCVGMRAPVAPQPRLSLNLSALLDSRRVVLLITGAEKWRTYLAASAQGPVQDMPVRAVLRQTGTPVEVAWSP